MPFFNDVVVCFVGHHSVVGHDYMVDDVDADDVENSWLRYEGVLHA